MYHIPHPSGDGGPAAARATWCQCPLREKKKFLKSKLNAEIEGQLSETERVGNEMSISAVFSAIPAPHCVLSFIFNEHRVLESFSSVIHLQKALEAFPFCFLKF